jgi:hypothetical protein
MGIPAQQHSKDPNDHDDCPGPRFVCQRLADHREADTEIPQQSISYSTLFAKIAIMPAKSVYVAATLIKDNNRNKSATRPNPSAIPCS